uniref:phosphoglycerate mutase (2,3-diphosphoglycerate-dependent) n=1 Tax=Peronospora matthiolae TaxID=2874970 RepID=A0AAV1UMY1_9STRA
MKVLTGLASLALAAVVATLTNILVQQKRQRDVRACGCSDGECCNSVRASERRYRLPRTHVVHWDTGKSECDPSWSEMVPKRVVEEAQEHELGSGGTLILLRHGQSVWNRKPDRPSDLWRYAGSIDIPLSEVGMQEALEAGKRLEFVPIDVVFCSQMDRARTTMSLALSLHSSKKTPVVEHCSPLERPSFEGVNDKSPYDFIIPVYVSPALNERNFGDLQGVPSTKHIVMFNRERVQKIRNDFYTRFPGTNGESCEDIHNRTIPFFNSFIMPHLAAGRNVLVSSHGFVIRTLIKYLDGMDATEFNEQMTLEKTAPDKCLLLAPTGVPLMYKYDEGKFAKIPQTRRDRAESLSRSSAPY